MSDPRFLCTEAQTIPSIFVSKAILASSGPEAFQGHRLFGLICSQKFIHSCFGAICSGMGI